MLSAKVNGMDSYLKEIGMKITVTDGEKCFVAHMMDDNVSINFAGDGNDSVLDPNKDYSVAIEPINNSYETDVPPEKVKELTMTFQAIAADGCHQVMFISQGETIESYIAFDNEVIEKVPEVSRSGYSFQGWFTPDGRQITDGYVISPNEGDIIAYAEWEKNESNNTIIYVGIGGGAAAIAAVLLLLLAKKKHSGETQ